MKKLIKIVLVLLVLGACVFGGYKLIKSNKNKNRVENKPVLVSKIEGYDYALEDRDKKVYKDAFMDLKSVLEKEEVDYKAYAQDVSKLFVIDLYTMDNKVSLYDVGGSEFVFEPVRENYELKVKDTLYKYLEDNSYNTRKQELPIVKNVEVVSIDTTKFKYDNKNYDGYSVKLTWEYEKDLGYDKKCTLIIIKSEGKLYVIEEKQE